MGIGHQRDRAMRGELVMAGILVVGVLVVGWGFVAQSRTALYAGVVIVVGGVLTGVIRLFGGNDA